MISCPYFLLTQLMRSFLFCDHFIVVFHSQMMTEHKIMKPLIQMSDAQCKGNCIKVPAYQSAYLPMLTKMIYCVLHICFFLPFIYFVTFREQDKADINSLRCSALVGFKPVYTHMWVARSTTVLQTPTCASAGVVQVFEFFSRYMRWYSWSFRKSLITLFTELFRNDLFSLVKTNCRSCSQTLF